MKSVALKNVMIAFWVFIGMDIIRIVWFDGELTILRERIYGYIFVLLAVLFNELMDAIMERRKP